MRIPGGADAVGGSSPGGALPGRPAAGDSRGGYGTPGDSPIPAASRRRAAECPCRHLGQPDAPASRVHKTPAPPRTGSRSCTRCVAARPGHCPGRAARARLHRAGRVGVRPGRPLRLVPGGVPCVEQPAPEGGQPGTEDDPRCHLDQVISGHPCRLNCRCCPLQCTRRSCPSGETGVVTVWRPPPGRPGGGVPTFSGPGSVRRSWSYLFLRTECAAPHTEWNRTTPGSSSPGVQTSLVPCCKEAAGSQRDDENGRCVQDRPREVP